MGYEVDFYSIISKENGVIKVTRANEDTDDGGFCFLTFPFQLNNLSEICMEHFLTKQPEDCNHCPMKHLWGVKEDVNCRYSDDIAKLAQNALAFLSSQGIKVGVRDPNNSRWGFGNCPLTTEEKLHGVARHNPLHPIQRLEILAYYIDKYLSKTKEFPNHIFIGTDLPTDSVVFPDGTKFKLQFVN